MARYGAIAATSEAILGLLEGAAAGTEFDGVSMAVYTAKDLEAPMTEGLSVWLYRVTVGQGRNLQPTVGPDGRRYRRPIPLDLHYLVTAWAGGAARQQRLLGWAIRTLENTPLLPAGLLNRRDPDGDVFRPDETVELVWEALSAQDASDVWEPAKTRQQPSAAYVARRVVIESDVAVEEHDPVQTRVVEYAEAVRT